MHDQGGLYACARICFGWRVRPGAPRSIGNPDAFRLNRDEAAFAATPEPHGPMDASACLAAPRTMYSRRRSSF